MKLQAMKLIKYFLLYHEILLIHQTDYGSIHYFGSSVNDFWQIVWIRSSCLTLKIKSGNPVFSHDGSQWKHDPVSVLN